MNYVTILEIQKLKITDVNDKYLAEPVRISVLGFLKVLSVSL